MEVGGIVPMFPSQGLIGYQKTFIRLANLMVVVDIIIIVTGTSQTYATTNIFVFFFFFFFL